MKAIVMAGGEGTRLRPLTEGRPKPMAEILGKPVLRRTVELLKRNGITDICFTLRYLPEMIRDEFGDGRELGVTIEHRVETEPLGTAGSVRDCRDFIGDEDVLIISGDGVCDFDLRAAVSFHRESGAEATIVVREQAEPTSFGLVIADADGRVRAFSEKPSWENVTTSLVNTGIYVLSPEAVELIPEKGEYDFGKDLFPRLLREGRKLYAVEGRGYWCDMGSPEAYRRCCMDLISGRVDIDLEAREVSQGIWSRVELDKVTLIPPVYVGEGCVIAPGASLGPEAVVSSGSRVEAGAKITGSVINGAAIGRDCRVDGAIVGRGATVGNGSVLGPGCVIGDGAVIGPGSLVEPGVRIWSNRRVPAGRKISSSVTAEAPEAGPEFIKDHILRAAPARTMTPETAMALGAVLGGLGRTGVSHTGGEAARLMADAIVCGVTSAGGEACVPDCDFEAELAAAGRVFDLKAGAFVRESGEELTVTFFGEQGLAAQTALRRRLEPALFGRGQTELGTVGSVSPMTGLGRMYISGVVEEVRAMGPAVGRVKVAVRGTGAENRTVRCVLAGLGHEVTSGPDLPAFTSGVGGFDLTCRDERGRELDATHTAALGVACAMRLGVERLAAPVWLPGAARRLGDRYGCRLIPADTAEGRELYKTQRILRDAAVEAAVIVTAMARDGATLSRLLDDLPPFAVEKRRVEISSGARAMRRMAESAEFSAELTGGLRLNNDLGTARIAPDFDGRAIVLRTEADDAETAAELAAELERRIRDAT